MRSILRIMGPLAVTAMLAVAAHGQEAPLPPPEMMAQEGPHGPGPGPGGPFPGHMELLGFGGFHEGKVVAGAPFSAVAISESSHALADGNKITRKTQATLYRDGQGRIRREVTMPPLGDAAQTQPHSLILIHDPVAGKGFILNPDKKIAHQMPDHRGHKGKGPEDVLESRPAHENEDANVTKDLLSTQSINGVSAQGTRYTRTIPAGQIGNDKPITITREEWYSPDLQMVVQSKHSDPRFGDTTYTLTNIQRTEPAANLFAVPADYTVKQGNPHRGMRHFKQGEMPPPPPDGAPPAPSF